VKTPVFWGLHYLLRKRSFWGKLKFFSPEKLWRNPGVWRLEGSRPNFSLFLVHTLGFTGRAQLFWVGVNPGKHGFRGPFLWGWGKPTFLGGFPKGREKRGGDPGKYFGKRAIPRVPCGHSPYVWGHYSSGGVGFTRCCRNTM